MEAIFRALSDASRRHLLDQLRLRDGQTLTELEAHMPHLSRFAVMKHLGILEKAALVVCRKVGRQKFHYLNPLPIQEVAERWISAYAKPWAGSLLQLKTSLERETLAMTSTLVKPKHVYELIIKTTPEKLWQALTDGQITPQYYYGFTLQGSLAPGENFNYLAPDGTPIVTGTVVECEPPRKLVTTFQGHWDPAMAQDLPSRVTYEITPMGDCCRLSLIHDEFEAETATYTIVGGGWPGILSGLKTLLETGKPLNFQPMAAN